MADADALDRAERKGTAFGYLPPKSVLLVVVEDAAVAESLSDGLARGKFEVVTAGDAGKAREILESGRVAAVVADMQMPHLPGVDLLSLVQSISPDAPIVFLTGQGAIGIAIEAMHEGAFGFLVKPISIPHLLAFMDRALEMRDLRLEVRQSRAELMALRAAAGQTQPAAGVAPIVPDPAAAPAVSDGETASDAISPLFPAAANRETAASAAAGGMESEDGLTAKLEEHVRLAVTRALEAHDWNFTHAAKALGISRSTLYMKAQRFGLRRGDTAP